MSGVRGRERGSGDSSHTGIREEVAIDCCMWTDGVGSVIQMKSKHERKR